MLDGPQNQKVEKDGKGAEVPDFPNFAFLSEVDESGASILFEYYVPASAKVLLTSNWQSKRPMRSVDDSGVFSLLRLLALNSTILLTRSSYNFYPRPPSLGVHKRERRKCSAHLARAGGVSQL